MFWVLMLTAPVVVKAQSLAQTIEQLSLDYEKLADYKQILADMYKGYTVIRAGYENIKSIAAGNFSLHQGFLNSLLAVSPAVAGDVRIANIINNEAELVKQYQAGEKLGYTGTLGSNLLSGSLRNLDELTMVITAGTLRMSDAERLAAIDRIDRDMRERLTFLRVFVSEAAIEAGQKGVDQNNISTMKGLYGIGN